MELEKDKPQNQLKMNKFTLLAYKCGTPLAPEVLDCSRS